MEWSTLQERNTSTETLQQETACETETAIYHLQNPLYYLNTTGHYRIDENFLIKITDFGLSEDIFERNYFRQGSGDEAVKLPVKWMAPESPSDGHFSEKSDVVKLFLTSPKPFKFIVGTSSTFNTFKTEFLSDPTRKSVS